jgi:ABC-type polysaccharide transport system permease subunit
MKKSQTSIKPKGTQTKWEFIKQHRMLYYMLLPGLILTLVFKYFPMYGILLAFKDYNPLRGIMGSEWVGVENFVQFIDSPNFGILLENTLKISIYGLILGFFPPILLALSLNHLISTKWKKRFQLILYAPNFISLVIVVGMLFMFLAADGPINGLIETITGSRITFMTDPELFPDFIHPIRHLARNGLGIGALHSHTGKRQPRSDRCSSHGRRQYLVPNLVHRSSGIAPDHGHPVHPFCRGDHERWL